MTDRLEWLPLQPTDPELERLAEKEAKRVWREYSLPPEYLRPRVVMTSALRDKLDLIHETIVVPLAERLLGGSKP